MQNFNKFQQREMRFSSNVNRNNRGPCVRAPLRATVENRKMTSGQGGNINKRII